MNIKRIGIDLAKTVFQLHGVDSREQPVLRKKLKREQMLSFFRTIDPLFDWDGSLQWVALLGTGTAKTWAYRQTDGAPICEALR
jgi:transposase